MKSIQDSLAWLYDGNIVHTPSTAGIPMSQSDEDYDLVDEEIPPSPKVDTKRDFKQWLISTEYKGRWRSTDNYQGLSQRDQAAFRSQAKAIFRHILKCQLSPNDADVVWEDLIDEETSKSTKPRDR